MKRSDAEDTLEVTLDQVVKKVVAKCQRGQELRGRLTLQILNLL